MTSRATLSYFARLTEPASAPMPSMPVRSPLTELDQRLHTHAEALPATDAAPAADTEGAPIDVDERAPVAARITRRAVAVQAEPRAYAAQALAEPRGPTRHLVMDPHSEPSTDAARVAHRDASEDAIAEPIAARAVAPLPPDAPATHEPAPAVAGAVVRTAPSPATPASPELQLGSALAAIERWMRAVDAPTAASPSALGDRSRPRRAPEPDDDVMAASDASELPPRLAPALTPPSPAATIALAAALPPQPPLPAARPRVVIGELHVEVVRARGEPKAKPQPATPAPRAPTSWPSARPFGWRQR